MIAEVFEEVSILLETFIKPCKLSGLEIGVCMQVPGSTHTLSVSVFGDRIYDIPNNGPFGIGHRCV
jgi:hypothetical protein